ncbi:MAG: amphi-Trp domain-containing protein [Deltaproteobacteria bacterium]|nr:amphi-Trp domain-containing protein [Deltaproteobacteria bacterium]
MSQNEKFEYESIQDNASVRNFIQSLLDGIEQGRIILQSNEDEIIMHPNNLLKLSVKARKKDDQGRLNIKVSWKESKSSVITTPNSLRVTA